MGEEAPREVVLERSPRSVLVPLFPLALALAAFVTTLYGLYYSVVLWRIEGSMARLVAGRRGPSATTSSRRP